MEAGNDIADPCSGVPASLCVSFTIGYWGVCSEVHACPVADLMIRYIANDITYF